LLTQKLLLKNKKSSTLTEIISPSGRRLYRHSSGMGTVLCFNDGQDREVLVLDAQYRGVGTMGSLETDYSLPDYHHSNYIVNKYSPPYTPSIKELITDEMLNAKWINDNNSAKHNCDIIIEESPSESPATAVEHARSIVVDDTPCDVPNIQTLQRIFCEAELLDSMDPTVNYYLNFALGSINPNGAFRINNIYACWSSTDGGFDMFSPEDLYSYSLYISYDGHCGYNGCDRSNTNGVIPVLELT
jgi:hypothetical protein